MTNNDGVAGLKAVIADFKHDFYYYLHFHDGDIKPGREYNLVEAFTGARILDACIERCEAELRREEDARCKALQTVAENIQAEWDEAGKELDKTTDTHDRATLIGQIQAYAAMLKTLNNMLPPAFQVSAVKYGQETDNAD